MLSTPSFHCALLFFMHVIIRVLCAKYHYVLNNIILFIFIATTVLFMDVLRTVSSCTSCGRPRKLHMPKQNRSGKVFFFSLCAKTMNAFASVLFCTFQWLIGVVLFSLRPVTFTHVEKKVFSACDEKKESWWLAIIWVDYKVWETTPWINIYLRRVCACSGMAEILISLA